MFLVTCCGLYKKKPQSEKSLKTYVRKNTSTFVFFVTYVFKLSSDDAFYEPKYIAQTAENTVKTVVVTDGLILFT